VDVEVVDVDLVDVQSTQQQSKGLMESAILWLINSRLQLG
jgi:hypothetical protein